MSNESKPLTKANMRALARKAIAEAVRKWRSEGLSDAEIEKKLDRPLPDELRS